MVTHIDRMIQCTKLYLLKLKVDVKLSTMNMENRLLVTTELVEFEK